ncbi:MAG: L7Ae/L30e/S12e/Gadd45 family ribosomal protein [Acholeplasmataceae bacterium]
MDRTLGLAYRAARVVVGTEKALLSLRKGHVKLVILATDASDNTKKRIHDKARTYGASVVEAISTERMSRAIGKRGIKVIGITDHGFSRLLMNHKGSEHDVEQKISTKEKDNEKTEYSEKTEKKAE